jgi:NAD(P)-dependent dehydrogenase (short-subunit alcohol dehydrogenase family)
MHIHDSVGVVTGSNGGIGQQFVAALLERGATTGLCRSPSNRDPRTDCRARPARVVANDSRYSKLREP